MRLNRGLALGASMLVLIVSACSTGGGSTKPTVKVGSDGFYEAKLMAEIYGQALEAKGYTVDRTGIGIGARKVSAPALESGQIDLKPEYIGSGLAYYEPGKQTGDPAANADRAPERADAQGRSRSSTTPRRPTTNAFVVRKETADQYHLAKMSDLTAVASQLKFGVATDCPTNPVCGQALKDARTASTCSGATLLSACDTPMAQALAAKTIDVGELCSTQPDIAVNGWVVLQDDKPPSRRTTSRRWCGTTSWPSSEATRPRSRRSSTTSRPRWTRAPSTDLGKQVSVDNKDITAVAKAWLQANGFVQ